MVHFVQVHGPARHSENILICHLAKRKASMRDAMLGSFGRFGSQPLFSPLAARQTGNLEARMQAMQETFRSSARRSASSQNMDFLIYFMATAGRNVATFVSPVL